MPDPATVDAEWERLCKAAGTKRIGYQNSESVKAELARVLADAERRGAEECRKELDEARRRIAELDPPKDCQCEDPARKTFTYQDGYVLCLKCHKEIAAIRRGPGG